MKRTLQQLSRIANSAMTVSLPLGGVRRGLLLLALVAIMMPIGAWAAVAADITVTIDTGTSVTLKDADGDGFYDIGTADELYAFAAAVNTGNNAINGELTANIVVNKNVLTADGKLSGDGSNFRVWTPIGNSRYAGTFDGAGFTVSGLYFNDSAVDNVGLFTCVSGGTVKNVGVIDSFLGGKSYVGGVVGKIFKGSVVTNCYNTGVVNGIAAIGGVAGYNLYGTITDCYNTGNVSGSGDYVGGVVGWVQSTNSKVTGCYNTGNVSGGKFVGGVAGYNSYGTITGCYNIGNISGNSNVGGVVGYNSSQSSEADSIVTGCYNTGTVSGNENVGGVVGYNSSNATVTNCYYDNTVYSGSAIGTNKGTSTNVRGKTADDFENGTVCELVGFHRPNENCVCIACGAVAHSLDENCICTVCGIVEHNFNSNGFCTVCETYQPAELNESGYYEITNAGQLFWFANHINTVDRTASAVLTADINLENRPWTPIGETNEASNNFRGHFDGQGHTIRGLKVEGGRAGLGFFGEVRTGTVENFTIYGEVVVSTDVSYVGGVIGSACGLNGSDHGLEQNGATIRNITSYVNLTAGAHGISMVGGFIGYANHETLIENCAWYGTFDAGKYRVDSGAGGFLGRVYDSSSVTIRNCAAYGTVKTAYQSGTHTESNGTPHEDIYIGGFLSFSPSGAQTLLQNNLWAGEIVNDTDLDIANAHLSAYGTLNDNTTVQNCYALEGTPYVTTGNAHTTGIATVTSAQLLSGEVAYLLQGEQAEQAWGQAIGTDDYPVLGGAAVYYGYLSCADDAVKVYTNTSEASDAKPGHSPVDGICTVCGHIDAASDVTLRDGALPSFTLAEDTEVASITYTRTLPNMEWNALYVPFEIPVSELAADYEVAYANNMHAYDTDDNGEIDELEMEVIKIKQGTLHANHPYFIRAKSEAARALTLTVEDAVLYATESVAMTCQSFYTTFTLTGTYDRMEAADFAALDGTHYAIALEGGWWKTEGLNPFRVYMTITEREGSPVKVSAEAMARVRIVTRGESTSIDNGQLTMDNEASGAMYDLQGRRVENPAKGIYIVNGRKVIF